MTDGTFTLVDARGRKHLTAKERERFRAAARSHSKPALRRPVHAREGPAYRWFVDPIDRALEAFELRDGEWVFIACAKDDDPASVRPFDAIKFSLGDLWA